MPIINPFKQSHGRAKPLAPKVAAPIPEVSEGDRILARYKAGGLAAQKAFDKLGFGRQHFTRRDVFEIARRAAEYALEEAGR